MSGLLQDRDALENQILRVQTSLPSALEEDTSKVRAWEMLCAVLCAYFNFFQLTVKHLFLYLLYAQTFYLVRWLNVDVTRVLQAPSAASSSDLGRSLRHSRLVEVNISALPSTSGHPEMYKHSHV